MGRPRSADGVDGFGEGATGAPNEGGGGGAREGGGIDGLDIGDGE